jgi:shikimate kinase
VNIALYGFMGVGKTTAGVQLARSLGYDFIDMDAEIERREGKSILEIFRDYGEPKFRELERDLVTDLSKREDTVIGCGGGALVDLVNAEKLRETSTLVYLTASVDAILERTGKRNNRPLLNVDNPRKKVVELLETRRNIYERYAEITINTTGKTPSQVAEEIREEMKQ